MIHAKAMLPFLGIIVGLFFQRPMSQKQVHGGMTAAPQQGTKMVCARRLVGAAVTLQAATSARAINPQHSAPGPRRLLGTN